MLTALHQDWIGRLGARHYQGRFFEEWSYCFTQKLQLKNSFKLIYFLQEYFTLEIRSTQVIYASKTNMHFETSLGCNKNVDTQHI